MVANAKFLLKELDFSKEGLGIIIPLTVKEIVELEEENFNQFLVPFLYDLSHDTEEIKFFDYLFVKDEQLSKILELLISSLIILYRTDEYEFTVEDNIISIQISNAKINRNNFGKLCDIIREMYFIKTKESEDQDIQVAEENKAVLEEYLRLKAEHEKEMEEQAKKDQKNTHQIITILASQCSWDYDQVLGMTYYRMIITFMSVQQIDVYKTYLKYASSGQFDMKNQKYEHWLNIVGK